MYDHVKQLRSVVMLGLFALLSAKTVRSSVAIVRRERLEGTSDVCMQ